MITKHSGSKVVYYLLAGFVISLCLAFRVFWNSPVRGSVNPPDGGSRAWLLSKTDTLSAPVIQGNFTIQNVRPGNYLLMVEGRSPYRDSFKQDIIVVDGQPTDVGVIEMHK